MPLMTIRLQTKNYYFVHPELLADPSLISEILIGLKASDESKLGFFSKVYRFTFKGENYIVKTYPAVRDKALIEAQHSHYCKALRDLGVQLPDTHLIELDYGKRKKKVVSVVQRAFDKEELCRKYVQKASLEEVKKVLYNLFGITATFWKNNPNKQSIGFHPTLRNFSFHNNSLHFFDTFPPMVVPQPEMNELVKQVAPIPKMYIWLEVFPFSTKILNMITNEYYDVTKMISNLVGSVCRLRPESSQELLNFAKNAVEELDITATEKNSIIKRLNSPPKLSGLWLFGRYLFGGTGRKNIKN